MRTSTAICLAATVLVSLNACGNDADHNTSESLQEPTASSEILAPGNAAPEASRLVIDSAFLASKGAPVAQLKITKSNVARYNYLPGRVTVECEAEVITTYIHVGRDLAKHERVACGRTSEVDDGQWLPKEPWPVGFEITAALLPSGEIIGASDDTFFTPYPVTLNQDTKEVAAAGSAKTPSLSYSRWRSIADLGEQGLNDYRAEIALTPMAKSGYAIANLKLDTPIKTSVKLDDGTTSSSATLWICDSAVIDTVVGPAIVSDSGKVSSSARVICGVEGYSGWPFGQSPLANTAPAEGFAAILIPVDDKLLKQTAGVVLSPSLSDLGTNLYLPLRVALVGTGEASRVAPDTSWSLSGGSWPLSEYLNVLTGAKGA